MNNISNLKTKTHQLAKTISLSLDKSAELLGETIVIKIGGSLLTDSKHIKIFAKNIITLKSIGVNVIIVHGGIDLVSTYLDNFELTKSSNAANFNRPTIESIEMIMTGYISKNIVNAINFNGGSAIGVSGKDANLISAKKTKRFKSNSKIENILDVGHLGEINEINPELLFSLEDSGLVPVISPIAFSESGDTYHVNSDQLALEIAKIYSASRLIYLSDNDCLKDAGDERIYLLNLTSAYNLLNSGDMDKDLSSKLSCSIGAMEDGIEEVMLLHGLTHNALLIALFSDELIGTKFSSK